jgi:hypothetical protein
VCGSFGALWGSAELAWQWGDPNALGGTVGSYGMNLWLLPESDQSLARPREKFWGRFVNVPGEAPLVGDSIWIGGWPEVTDDRVADTENGNATSDPTQPGTGWEAGGMMGRWIINRHQLQRMAINLSFADGTARHVRLGELWNQKWHKEFLPTAQYEGDYP